MYSSLLKKKGLQNIVVGADSTFKDQHNQEMFLSRVKYALESNQMYPIELYSGEQVHSNQIAYADGKTGEPFVYGKIFNKTDGLITDKPGIALLIKFADCTPIVLYDPIKKVQASVHSGWKGTLKRIASKAIDKMVKEFSCNRKDIFAYMGPSIDQENYEVGPEVYEAFSDFENRDTFFKPRGNKYVLSMLDANLSILKQAGIQGEQIEIEETSTYTNPTLHSARAEGEKYQLNALITMIKE